jgi:hypothetical protein
MGYLVVRIVPDHQRVELTSDDVAMGAYDPAIGDPRCTVRE